MDIVIDYTEMGIGAGWCVSGTDLSVRRIRFPDDARKNNAVYNEILAAGACEEATEFLRDSLKKIREEIPSPKGLSFYFLLPAGVSGEALVTFRRVCTDAGEGLGQIKFLTREEALGGYLAGRGIAGKVAVLTCGRQLSLFECEVGKEDGRHVMSTLRVASQELPFSVHELLLSALGQAACGENAPVPMNSLEPPFSILEEDILSDEAEDAYGFWEIMSEKGPVEHEEQRILDFKYKGRNCSLLAEHVYAAIEPFRKQLRLLGAISSGGKIPKKLCCYGVELPRVFVKSAVRDALYHPADPPEICGEGAVLLEGALRIAAGDVSFSFEFPYTLGIKTFVYAEGEEGVIVKPIYLPLVLKGEKSSAYQSEVKFDGSGFKAGDEDANIVLFVKDDKDRIREIPVMRVSEVAKTDDSLEIGIRVDGREVFLVVTNGETKRDIPLSEMIDASAPSLLKTSPRSVNIE